jgi:hypothetical protein
LIVRAAPKEDFTWIGMRTGCVLTQNARAIEAVDETGWIRGMVAFDNWTDNAVQVHIATDTPIAWRYLAGPGLEYPFIQGKRGVVIGLIARSNKRSCRFARKMGFEEVGCIEDGQAVGDDLLLFRLRREVWLAARRLGIAEPERRAG